MDTSALRRHAWMTLAFITRPSGPQLPGQEHRLATWQTWYPPELTFAPEQNAPKRSPQMQLALELPIQLESTRAVDQFLPLSRVFYNPPLFERIRERHYYEEERLSYLASSGGALEFPPDSIAVKTVWMPGYAHACSQIPVWNSITGVPEEQSSLPQNDWPDRVYVAPPGVTCPPGPIAHISDFYNFKLQSVDGLADSSFKDAHVGDYALLVALHITTRELPNWIWSTFWWHNRPSEGVFAADRPREVSGPWRNYLMDVAYDMDRPRERDGSPKITFNPYLEGLMPRGSVSNCMTCHARAFWPPTDAAPVVTSFAGRIEVSRIVVRGSDAALRTYYPKQTDDPKSRFLRTGFLWSFQRVTPLAGNASGASATTRTASPPH